MRIVFMGTPEFAKPSLLRLVQDGHDVCAVFTQPDRPKGRGYVITPPPIKQLALELSLKVYQPESLRDDEVIRQLRDLEPDVIVVVAYGKILPLAVLSLPPHGCINLHASLLPKYRGAAPIQWAIIRGEKVTGVTTMLMDVGMDTGDILLQRETPIGENETAGQLHDRLSVMGADLLSDTLKELEKGALVRTAQIHSLSTYAPLIDKSICSIDWNKTALEIHNHIRGLYPWPIATTVLNGKTLRIHRARPITDMNIVGVPGEINTDRGFIVSCGDNTAIELIEVQYDCGKRMTAKEFLCGHPIVYGTILSSRKDD